MRTYILLWATLIISTTLFAQEKITFNQPLRYNEDYSFLKNENNKTPYQKLKYTKLGKADGSYISAGGEIRYQYFYVKNETWGDDAGDKDGYILTRYLLHTDVHITKNIRTFVQFQSSLANGKASGTSPVDENVLDLHQAFADVSVPIKDAKLTIRLGRQEMMLGSGRLVAVRDGPNNRQSFDAAKIMFNQKKWNTELFYAYYVVSQKNIFDDKWLNPDSKLWGMYTVLHEIPFLKNLDIYYLGAQRKKSVYDAYEGGETRHSTGLRIWSNAKPFSYDVEAVYQLGKAGANTIQAWTFSSNTSYQFRSVKGKPVIGLKTELVSGDNHAGDHTLQTFNALFPKGNYFGWAALIGPANLFDVHPSVEFQLLPKWKLNIEYDMFRRLSTGDGIYGPNTFLLYSGKQSNSKAIGNQYSVDITYTPNAHLYFRPELTFFKTGQYLKDVSAGKNIVLAAFTAQLKF